MSKASIERRRKKMTAKAKPKSSGQYSAHLTRQQIETMVHKTIAKVENDESAKKMIEKVITNEKRIEELQNTINYKEREIDFAQGMLNELNDFKASIPNLSDEEKINKYFQHFKHMFTEFNKHARQLNQAPLEVQARINEMFQHMIEAKYKINTYKAAMYHHQSMQLNIYESMKNETVEMLDLMINNSKNQIRMLNKLFDQHAPSSTELNPHKENVQGQILEINYADIQHLLASLHEFLERYENLKSSIEKYEKDEFLPSHLKEAMTFIHIIRQEMQKEMVSENTYVKPHVEKLLEKLLNFQSSNK